jgi:hypothetical protein
VGLLHGSLKATPSGNGKRPAHCCGFMESVRGSLAFSLHLLMVLLSGFWKEYPLVSVKSIPSRLIKLSYSIIALRLFRKLKPCLMQDQSWWHISTVIFEIARSMTSVVSSRPYLPSFAPNPTVSPKFCSTYIPHIMLVPSNLMTIHLRNA